MNRKHFIVVLALAVMTVALSGCDAPANPASADVTLVARFDSAALRAVVAGTVVTTVDHYRVVFKKVEIGNSEDDKFTLWESVDPAGQEMDIVSPVTFEGANPAVPGTYNYVRFTIGTTLGVDGSIVDGATTYTGTGSAVLGDDRYLFGVDLPNGLGVPTVTAPVTVEDGMTLALEFDPTGTVTYEGGPETAAVLGVTEPVLAVISE